MRCHLGPNHTMNPEGNTLLYGCVVVGAAFIRNPVVSMLVYLAASVVYGLAHVATGAYPQGAWFLLIGFAVQVWGRMRLARKARADQPAPDVLPPSD